jgi:hypothetical protein
MNYSRLITALFIAALAALVLSCGGGQSTPRGTTVTKDKPVVLTRAGELAKLEALTKPAKVTEEQWRELKTAMAALIPEKTVSVPPRTDEVVGDLAFSRDEQGVGSLTWSYYLRNDYNLDGVVDAADVTAIADHFGEAVDASPVNWLIDTSGDGVIGVADITGIASRYGLSLLGFRLQYTSDTQEVEIAVVPRAQAVYGEDGYMHFTFPYDTAEWTDLTVVPIDLEGNFGLKSNVVQFQPPRILSVSVPSGQVGDPGQFSAEVEGAAPLEYDWILSNGSNPNRSTDPVVDVTLANQGNFNGKLTVSNVYGSAEQPFNLTIGVPPAITSVSPAVGTTGGRTMMSAVVTGPAPISYSWSFGPNSFPSASGETAPGVIFDTDGLHNCSLTVTNPWGSSSYPFTVTTGSVPQIVNVTPLLGAVDSSCTFGAEVLGTAPFSYSWNFQWMSDPATSGDTSPTVTLVETGDYLCKLDVSNAYGQTTYWFNFHVGAPPNIEQVMGTSTMGADICWFLANYTGEDPMAWTWTFDMFAPDPPLVFEGFPVNLMLPDALGTFNCSVTAENAYGSDTYDFQYTITEVPPDPL